MPLNKKNNGPIRKKKKKKEIYAYLYEASKFHFFKLIF